MRHRYDVLSIIVSVRRQLEASSEAAVARWSPRLRICLPTLALVSYSTGKVVPAVFLGWLALLELTELRAITALATWLTRRSRSPVRDSIRFVRVPDDLNFVMPEAAIVRRSDGYDYLAPSLVHAVCLGSLLSPAPAADLRARLLKLEIDRDRSLAEAGERLRLDPLCEQIMITLREHAQIDYLLRRRQLADEALVIFHVEAQRLGLVSTPEDDPLVAEISEA